MGSEIWKAVGVVGADVVVFGLRWVSGDWESASTAITCIWDSFPCLGEPAGGFTGKTEPTFSSGEGIIGKDRGSGFAIADDAYGAHSWMTTDGGGSLLGMGIVGGLLVAAPISRRVKLGPRRTGEAAVLRGRDGRGCTRFPVGVGDPRANGDSRSYV